MITVEQNRILKQVLLNLKNSFSDEMLAKLEFHLWVLRNEKEKNQ
jgi:hypothetical protein